MQKPAQHIAPPPNNLNLQWLGLGLVGLVVLATLIGSAAVHQNDEQRLQNALQKRSSDLAREISNAFEARSKALDRMAARWEAAKGTPHRLWHQDAMAYRNDFDGTQSVGWADPQGKVVWMAPLEGNESLQHFDMGSDPIHAATLARATSTGNPEISAPIDFVQGEKGIMIARVLRFDGRDRGYLFMGFRFLNLLHKLNQTLAEQGHTLSLTHDGVTAFHAPALSAGTEHVAEAPIPMGDGMWRLQLRMSHETAAAARSSTPDLIMAAGMSTALLLALLFWLMVRSLRQREQNSETELRWRFAVESSDLGLWDWDAVTDRVYFSSRWKAMLGYEDAEIGDHLEEWECRVHPEDIKDVREKLERHINGETALYESDHRLLCKDGSYKWIHDRGRIMARNKDGKPLRMLGTHTDITERRLLEQVRRDQDRQTRLTLESQNVATFVIDREHRIQQWNPACEILTGIPASQIIGTTEAWRGFYPSARPCLADLVLEAREKEASQFYEIDSASPLLASGWHAEGWFDHVGGKRRYLVFDAAPIRDDQGQITAVVETLQDYTEQKHGEELLRDGREIARQALESLKHQKYALDQHAIVAVTDVQGRIIYANEKFCQISGYSHEELIGQDHILINSGVHPHGFFKEMYQTIARGQVWKAEICNRAKDGHLYWVDSTVAPMMDVHGKPEQYISIRSDITERKIAEEELKKHRDHLQELVAEQTAELRAAKELAEQANQAKSEFLANMSHELRTPLHAILSFSELGKEKAESASPEKLRGYFERVNISGNRLLALLNDLLDLSKLEAGKMMLRIEKNDVLGILLRSLAEFDIMFQANRIDLQLLPVECETLAEVDETRFMQVCMNLISNAMKFTPPGGKILLRMDATTLKHGRRSADVESEPAISIQIIDSGVGIPESELQSIFDKFVQSTKTNDGSGGTGLGLSICKEIIEAHHGTITAQNRPEGGAIFTVTLPYAYTNFAQLQE